MSNSTKPKLYQVLIRLSLVAVIVSAVFSLLVCSYFYYHGAPGEGHLITIKAALFVAFILSLVMYPLIRYYAKKIVYPITKIAGKADAFNENYRADMISWTVLDDPVYEEVAVLNKSFQQMGEKVAQLMYVLEKHAHYDHLTGLANRFYFFKRGKQILELIQRSDRCCAMLFLDVDDFKSVNDRFGHIVGDEVLVHISSLLETNIRVSDLAGRVGGEEFTIALPDTDVEGAKLLAERLRRIIAETPFFVGKHQLYTTVSIGISVYRGNKVRTEVDKILKNLMSEADAAMYKAKEKGRNRVHIYGEEETGEEKGFEE